MQDHTLIFSAVSCCRHSETISDCLLSSLPAPLLLANTNVPVPLVNPHPPLPSTHTHTYTLHTWMHTGMRGEWHNPPNAKTWAAWSALCSTADLMNGHSDTQTKLGLDFYYTSGSKVTQSTDRSRNQRWMPVSLSNTESLQQSTKTHCLKHTHKKLLIVIYLHYYGSSTRTLWATREQCNKSNESITQR